MSPAHRVPATGRRVERLRVAVACLVLTAVVFAQDAGRVVPDTKLDLTVDPLGLLARGLHLWDPSAGAGQLQNQAYGYLFPLGPVFVVLQALGLPDWAVQRVWQSLVLCTALLGVRALAARLGLGTPGTRLLAGAAYALAARPLSQVGAISIEVWPGALAPWVLVPLVAGVSRGSPRRAAARSGLAVLLAGGVNAAATLAVVPLGVLWLAVAPPGPRRRRLAAWWALALALATAWWLGPLLLLGRYSPPFLEVIESAATTTAQTGLWSVLTGNDLWLQYLSLGGPARPAGWLLVTEGVLVLCVTAVTVLGLLGVLRRGTPHRGFLAGGVLLGLLVVGAGHVGPLGRPLAGFERDLLDGALAAFRNVHKYDLLLRLPLALGLAHAASEVRLPRGSSGARPFPRARPVAVLAAVAVLGGAAPALGSLQPPGSFTALPGYWQEVAGHLDERARATGPAPARALVVPAASFGEYAWGGPRDEPLQPLADSPWVVRDAVPLGGPGVTRVLDVVEEVLRSGRGSPALAPFLARAGIGRLVVRNDLDPVRTGAVRPLVLHAALAGSPGLRRTASFGPPVGAGFGTGTEVVDAQLAAPYPAVEVYEVEQDVPALTTWERAGTQRVSGGPETVLPLLEHGLLDPTGAVRLAGEPSLAGEESELRTVTDGYRDREADLGRAADQRSATLGAGAVRRLDRPVADHLPVRGRAARTTAVLQGLRAVTASSSAADADALLVRGRDHVAAAAFDGDAATSWLTGGLRPAGEWVEARFAPTALTGVDVGPAAAAGPVGRPVRVRVSNGRRSVEVALGGGMTRVPLAGTTSRLRVTLLDVAGPGRQGFGTSGVEVVLRTVGGPLVAQRGLRLPADAAVSTGGRPAAAPLAVLLTAARRDRSGCVPLGDRPVCASSLPLGDEDSTVLDRTLTVDDPLLAGVAVAGRVRPGPEVDALLSRGQPVTASATSRAVPDAAGGPLAAVDRDLRTGWLAGRLDLDPALELRWPQPRRVTGVQVLVDENLAASRPRSVAVQVDGGAPVTAVLRRDGTAAVPPVTGRSVRVRFPQVQQRRSVGLDGERELLPVGVTELRVLGPAGDPLRQRRSRAAVVSLPCGQGPSLAVDGDLRLVTRVETTAGALLDGGSVVVEPCGGPLELAAGPSRLRMAATPTVSVTALALVDLARPPPASSDSRVERVVRWGSTERSVEVVPGPASFLVVHEAANDGWTARLDGQRLRPVRLDGWQQGFVLPSGGGRVELVFAPDRPYRAALVVGALLALGLLALALLPVRSRVELPAARVRSPARRRAGAVLALAALPLLAGPAGLVALVLVAALGWRAPRLLPWVGAGGLAGAGVLVALEPWPERALLGRPVTVLCLAAVAALAVSLWPDGRAPGRAAAAPAPRPAAATPTPRPG